MRHATLAAIAFAITCALASPAAAAPQAYWLWADPAGGVAGGNAFLRQTIHVKPGLTKAILLGAVASGGKMEVIVNGKSMGVVQGQDKPTAIDLTNALRLGNNAIALKATGATGAGAAPGALNGVAIMLEMVRDDGQAKWLVTDESWLGSANEVKGWDAADFDASTWKPAVNLGKVGDPAAKVRPNPFEPAKITDAYGSWRLAVANGQATDPKTISAPPGFTVELIRSAQPGEDSWIALAFDPKGRLTIAKERKGLLRMTLLSGGAGAAMTAGKVESINDTLLECRGLVYAHGGLYVNANNSKALYKLRDTTPNDTIDFLDESKLLLRTEGSVGHGRNHLTLGPDGFIYIMHGNDVRLPANLAPKSPYKSFDADQLIANPWDAGLDSGGEQVPGGHVIKMDKDGAKFELIAAGFRNPMALAFNADGEMFTYDADMEWDVGTPWYRPTRINHIISGGEYGWRRSTAKWPAHYADSMGSVCDTGLGSPTAAKFGTASKFPQRYQQALFAADWAYGRILAVHLVPQGSTYTGGFEPFLTGRPLNVTDFTFGPDGAMYVITGGRQTQSGLYRVRYTGPVETPVELSEAEIDANFKAEAARFKRAELEAAHQRLAGDEAKAAVKNALASLGSDDRAMRFAARVALEHQDPALWLEAVVAQKQPAALIHGLIAVARVGELKNQAIIFRRLGELPFNDLTVEEQLAALRAYTLALVRMGKPGGETAAGLLARLEPLYPSKHRYVNHELCELLVFLGSDSVRDNTFALIDAATEPEDLIQYLYTIRNVKASWSREALSAYFRGLNKAAHMHPGRFYVTAVKQMRVEVGSALPNAVKQELADLIAEPPPPPTYQSAHKALFVRDWTMDDLVPTLEQAAAGRSFEKGRDAYFTAQCAACHRFASHVPGSELGPDLTAIASRFNRRDLLETIIHPSKVVDDKFKQTQLTLTDGSIVSGQLGPSDASTVMVFPTPMARDAVTVAKKDVASQKLSDVSLMPSGLLSVLTREQILDLLAYLESGGKPEHGAYGK